MVEGIELRKMLWSWWSTHSELWKATSFQVTEEDRSGTAGVRDHGTLWRNMCERGIPS